MIILIPIELSQTCYSYNIVLFQIIELLCMTVYDDMFLEKTKKKTLIVTETFYFNFYFLILPLALYSRSNHIKLDLK